MPPDVRLAAAVILARRAGNGFELYLTRRSTQSTFAPDAFVFPGGAVEAQDRSPAIQARTLGLDAIDDPVARSLRVTALRELFEEAAVLFACTRSGEQLGAPEMIDDRDRCATFADALASYDAYADARRLIVFSHWITPANQPRRFDTHFFFAAASDDQTARADAIETHDGTWISAAEALKQYREGRFHAIFPTLKHLERLANLGSLEDALAFAREKPVRVVEPTVTNGGYVIPAELDDTW